MLEGTTPTAPESVPQPGPDPASGRKFEPEAEPFFQFQSRRSVVHSTRGIIACTNPLAGQAGLKILEAGGNAADAAVAVSAVLAVVDPPMTGIGGDSFALYFDAANGTVKGLNASGRSPLAATREIVARALGVPVDASTGRITDEDAAAGTPIPASSIHAVNVPAGAASWVDLVEQFGSGKLTLAQILDPAIRLADGGFPVSRLSAYYWRVRQDLLRTESPDNAGHVLLQADPATSHGVRAPREGELFRIPDLAETLRRLAAHGKAGFYEGPVAEAIVAATRAKGGLLSLDDLKHHAALPPDISDALSMSIEALGTGAGTPASTDSHGANLHLWEHPPNGQGIVALLATGILKELERTHKIPPLRSLGHNTAPYLHAVVSALRIAFADASWFVADLDGRSGRDEDRSNPQHLLSPEYLAKRAALYDPDQAIERPLTHGTPCEREEAKVKVVQNVTDDTTAALNTSDTVYFAVTDEHGNGCSFVNSVSDAFGSCLVPEGTGFVLPNRGRMFRLGPPHHPNVFAGGKRAYNTIIPAILTRDDGIQDGDRRHRLHAAYGVMGGFMQPQGHVQVLLNMEAFGLDPQAALDAPRVCVAANAFWTPERREGTSADTPEGTVYAEEGIPNEAADGLRKLGYDVVWIKGYARSLFGRGQVIRAHYDPAMGRRVYSAGSDGRGDGHAVPLL